MKPLNLLYVLGPPELSKWNNNEIRYSLRSMNSANVGWVGIAGPHVPAFLSGITHIRLSPSGNRYKNTQLQILAACSSALVPEDLVLMNDDFMVKNPEKWSWIQTHRGTMMKRCTPNEWKRSILDTVTWTESKGVKTSINYEGHTPFMFKKSLARPLLEEMQQLKQILQFRTAYGNLNHVGGEQFQNAKRSDPDKMTAKFPFWSLPPEPSDKAKKFLKEWLPKPSRWEV